MMAQEWVEDLEKDLAEAVEVKNRDSLHRYMSRLAEQFGKTAEAGRGHSEQPSNTDKRFEEMIHNMDKRFEAVDKRFEDMQRNMDKRFEDMHKSMDKRFEAVDKRFEEMQKNMDKRFEEMTSYMDKRFNSMQMLTVLGFTVLATMMTVIRLFG